MMVTIQFKFDPVWPKNLERIDTPELTLPCPFREIAFSHPPIEPTIPTRIDRLIVGGFKWIGPRLLAYITGTVDQELLVRNEWLVAENRILKAQIKARLRLSDAERITLAEIAHRLGRQGLEEVAAVAKPDTILGWYRKLIA